MTRNEILFIKAQECYYNSKGDNLLGHLTLRNWIETIEWMYKETDNPAL